MDRKTLAMAKEWAREIGKIKTNKFNDQQIIADEVSKGFTEVERGRHPDVVLKEVLARIGERLCPSSEPMPAKNADTSSKLH